jgi:head-tail adaptor
LHEGMQRADQHHSLEEWTSCLRVWVDIDHTLLVRFA